MTSIYGIGRSRSKKILDKLEIPFMKKVKDISEEEQKKISDELQNYVLEKVPRQFAGVAVSSQSARGPLRRDRHCLRTRRGVPG